MVVVVFLCDESHHNHHNNSLSINRNYNDAAWKIMSFQINKKFLLLLFRIVLLKIFYYVIHCWLVIESKSTAKSFSLLLLYLILLCGNISEHLRNRHKSSINKWYKDMFVSMAFCWALYHFHTLHAPMYKTFSTFPYQFMCYNIFYAIVHSLIVSQNKFPFHISI